MDPIEAKAVRHIFDPTSGIHIGSIKPNLDHSEGTSGLNSLIKTVIALENLIIPPNIKFNKPKSSIPYRQCGLSVPTEAIN